MQTTKEKIQAHLLKLANNHYNIRWVQATPEFEGDKRYLVFYNTQDMTANLGKIEIKEGLTSMQAGDLVREVKYPLLDPATLEKHLAGMRNVEPEKYNNYKTHYEQTILDNIDLEAYNTEEEKLYDQSIMTEWEQVRATYKIFEKEYLHHNNRHIPKQLLFKDWLQGLPSVLTIPFMNVDILEKGKEAGFKLETEEQEDTFLEEYWQKCANAFFNLKENL